MLQNGGILLSIKDGFGGEPDGTELLRKNLWSHRYRRRSTEFGFVSRSLFSECRLKPTVVIRLSTKPYRLEPDAVSRRFRFFHIRLPPRKLTATPVWCYGLTEATR